MTDFPHRDADRPRRIVLRPDPAAWGDDELLTLAEAAALLWPDGPLTAHSLHVAAAAGRLPVTMIARKLLTTKRALKEMSQCAARTDPATAANGANAPRAGPRRRDDAYPRRRLTRRFGATPD